VRNREQGEFGTAVQNVLRIDSQKTGLSVPRCLLHLFIHSKGRQNDFLQKLASVSTAFALNAYKRLETANSVVAH
jgi:hypothetical protein